MDRIKVRVVLAPGATLPRYAHDDDSCADLFSNEDRWVPAEVGENVVKVDLGVSLQPEPGYGFAVRGRSGLTADHKLILLGTVDGGYRKSIQAIVMNATGHPFLIRQGDKIAQLFVERVTQADFHIVDELDQSERGNAGFGSTGNA